LATDFPAAIFLAAGFLATDLLTGFGLGWGVAIAFVAGLGRLAGGFFVFGACAGGLAGFRGALELPFGFFFFGGGLGLMSRVALALVADEEDSAVRREELAVGGAVALGRFEVRAESVARFLEPVSRVERPARCPDALSTASGKPSSARLKPLMLLPGALGWR
jgi:hypothetical protein